MYVTDYVDASAIPDIASGWSDVFLRCRTQGHDFLPEDAVFVVMYNYMRVTSKCRCGAVKTEERTVGGRRLAALIDYPEGYLLHDIGRIAGEAKDVLYMQGLNRIVKIRKQTSRRSVDPPRSAITKKALGLDIKKPDLQVVRDQAS